jgi:annexin A7/11
MPSHQEYVTECPLSDLIDLCLVVGAWESKYIHDDSLEKTLKGKLSGSMEEACLLLLKDPVDACCEKLKAAFDGLGTDEDAVSRIIGGLDKREAGIVAERYQSKYSKVLIERIQDEVGGNYAKSMITWLTAPDVTGGLEYLLSAAPIQSNEHEELVAQAMQNVKQSVAELDTEMLLYAAKGIGTDERLVVQILCARTKEQLDAIDQVFIQKHNRTLKEYIKKEMGGNLELFLTYCQLAEDEFDALLLKKAFSGLGCDKTVVLEVICTRPFERLEATKAYYEAHYDANLMDRLRSELSGPLERLCVNLFARPRSRESEEPLNEEATGLSFIYSFLSLSLPCLNLILCPILPLPVARQLYEMGAGRFGTHEESFVDIFSTHSVEEMKLIADAYDRMFGTSLQAAVKSEFSGSIKEALLNLLEDPIDVYCRKLKSASVDQIGTDEATVCRVIGGNNKATVHTIAHRYFEKYNTVLVEDLRNELSGDFREAVLTYINTSDITGGLEELIKQVQQTILEQSKVEPEPEPAPVVNAPPLRMDPSPASPPPAAVTQVAEEYTPSNDPPEVMKGWGTKEGHVWKTWKRRFFVLESDSTSSTVRYYVEEAAESPYGEDMKGEINVRGYTATTKNLDNGTAVYLSGKHDGDKDLTILIDGAQERAAWVKAVADHVAYRKFMDDKQRARQMRDF